MKRFNMIVARLGLLAVGACAGIFFGRKWGHFDLALTENKVAALRLRNEKSLDPEFREYLKARIYLNVHRYYPSDRGYLLPKDWDFGPVDHNLLEVSPGKDPMNPVWTWEDAIANK
jgi:hypothetical protein